MRLHEEVDDTLDHEGRVALPGVHPPRHKDDLLVHVRLIDIVRYRQHIADVLVDRVAELLDAQTVLQLGTLISLLLQDVEIVLQIVKGVWLKVGEEHGVIVVFEGVAER